MKAIVLDFEATDATEDAQATDIGCMGVALKIARLVKLIMVKA